MITLEELKNTRYTSLEVSLIAAYQRSAPTIEIEISKNSLHLVEEAGYTTEERCQYSDGNILVRITL